MKFSRYLLFGLSLFYSLEAPQAQVYTLDFGAYPAEGYQQIAIGQSPASFRWLQSPESDFYHEKYKAWRFPAWLDGVVAPELAWEMQVPDGIYELQLFLSTGLELTSTWKVSLNNQAYPLNLHPIRNNPEPTTTVNPQVKIWRTELEITEGKLKVALTGSQDSIRLLAAHLLIKKGNNESLSPKQSWLEGMLRDYGKLRQDPKPLDPILDNLKTVLAEDPKDAWTFKYFREATWLHLAEHFLECRGWQWSTNLYRMSMIRKFQQAVMLLDPIMQQEEHPLYERALWLRGRLLYHLDKQYDHPPSGEVARKDFQHLLKRYPQYELIRMYLGEAFPNHFPQPFLYQHAPEWSKAQAIGLSRLRRLVQYWVLERQAPNGEMGGKYGDDVEALRFFPPLVYLGDSITTLGVHRLASGVWNSKVIKNGFARDVSDVEHASEFISDTAPLLIAATDDEELHKRALPTAYLMDTLWTQKDPAGNLFFRSSWYSSSDMDLRPPRNRDVPFNTRTTKVLRYYLWRYPDDAFVKDLLYKWTKSWVKLAAGTAKGKPEGILPVSYRPSDGAVNGDEPNWYRANMYWPYYDFRGDVMMLDQMLFLQQYIEDDALLEPVEAVLQLVNKYRETGGKEGSAAWAAAKFLEKEDFHALAGQWRLLTGKTDYDPFLLQYGSPYLKYRINGDMDALLESIRSFNEDIGYNWPMQTEEAWFTDRIFASDSTEFRRLNSDILKAMLTGDIIRNGTSPYMAVSWDEVRPGFTALVEDHSHNHLRVSIFSHNPSPQQLALRVWNLEPKSYSLYVNGEELQKLHIKNAGQRVLLNIPAGLLLNVEIR